MTLDRFEAEDPLVREAARLNQAAPPPLRPAAALLAHVVDRRRSFPPGQAGNQDYDTAPLEARLAAGSNGPGWRSRDSGVDLTNELPGAEALDR